MMTFMKSRWNITAITKSRALRVSLKSGHWLLRGQLRPLAGPWQRSTFSIELNSAPCRIRQHHPGCFGVKPMSFANNMTPIWCDYLQGSLEDDLLKNLWMNCKILNKKTSENSCFSQKWYHGTPLIKILKKIACQVSQWVLWNRHQ